jgi:biopolymer transport protein ExbD
MSYRQSSFSTERFMGSYEGVPSGKLVEIVDQARLAGAKSVGVATEKEAG